MNLPPRLLIPLHFSNVCQSLAVALQSKDPRLILTASLRVHSSLSHVPRSFKKIVNNIFRQTTITK